MRQLILAPKRLASQQAFVKFHQMNAVSHYLL
uniref:Uncharacterized protein n=1 Tax=Anguilla anguilla TaxID=7936 RepID=A0A0E9PWJ6_ANGAN